MPRQDCAKIDYSLGRPVLFSGGFLVLVLKKKKKSWAWTNSCQEQFPPTISLCWIFQPSLKITVSKQGAGDPTDLGSWAPISVDPESEHHGVTPGTECRVCLESPPRGCCVKTGPIPGV